MTVNCCDVHKQTIEEIYNSIEALGLIPTINKMFGKGAKLQIPYSESACNTEITALNLSVRSTNCLMRAGIKTVEQVIEAIQDNSLLRIRNLGYKSLAEIRAAICQFGYTQLSEKARKHFIENLIELNKNKIS